jgi:hypothetical protein
MNEQLQMSPGQVVFGLVIGFLMTSGTLYVGSKIAQSGPLEFNQLIRAAVAAGAVNLIFVNIYNTTFGTRRALTWLIAQSVLIWVLKSTLEVAWMNAVLIWGISAAVNLVALLLFGAVLSELAKAVTTTDQVAVWHRSSLPPESVVDSERRQ